MTSHRKLSPQPRPPTSLNFFLFSSLSANQRISCPNMVETGPRSRAHLPWKGAFPDHRVEESGQPRKRTQGVPTRDDVTLCGARAVTAAPPLYGPRRTKAGKTPPTCHPGNTRRAPPPHVTSPVTYHKHRVTSQAPSFLPLAPALHRRQKKNPQRYRTTTPSMHKPLITRV